MVFLDYMDESALPTHVSSLIDLRSYAWNARLVHRLFDPLTTYHIMALDRPSVRMDDLVY